VSGSVWSRPSIRQRSWWRARAVRRYP
jgi:hypothetical protein